MKLKEHSKCGKIAKCTDIYIYIYYLNLIMKNMEKKRDGNPTSTFKTKSWSAWPK
jgi:hypothetical protein